MKFKPFPKSMTWLNTERPLTLNELKGHVVLLYFWTYSCINCIHALSDIAWLEEKYKDNPFIVIGIHSAKFSNEMDIDNIESAIERYEINYPVLVDNNHRLWTIYGITAWPSFILIDANSNIMGKVSGEGFRDEIDEIIEKELKKAKILRMLAKEKIKISHKKKEKTPLSYPEKLDIDKANNRLFISDSNNNRILIVKLSSKAVGEVTGIIGNGVKGVNDGNYHKATFHRPQGVIYHDNALYVCDTENHALRKIDLRKEIVITISVNGKQDCPLNSPWDGVVQGNFLYIAMAGSHQLWRMNLETCLLEVFAGSGRENIIDGHLEEAQLAQPSGITSDESKLFFCDSETSAIRYVDVKNSNVETLIGKGLFKFGYRDGSFRTALLQHPMGLCYHDNRLYISDTYNHAIRVADLEKNKITTLISRPQKGVCSVKGKKCNGLPLNEPNDVLYNDGLLYIADTNNHLIRVFDIEQDTLMDLNIKF